MKKTILLCVVTLILLIMSSCREQNVSYDNAEKEISFMKINSEIVEATNELKKINSDIDDAKNLLKNINLDIAEAKNGITQNSNEVDRHENSMSTTDYPLIDIPLRYNDSDITLIIANNILQPGTVAYLITNNKDVLEQMQCILNVSTFPKGHGTTPDSCIYVYQDNALIKEIPFLGTYINNGGFELKEVSKPEVEKIIGQSLPSPI